MKKFTIEYHGWRSYKEEFGDDFVFFDGLVYTDEDLKNYFPMCLPLKLIEEQIKETIPSGAEILQRIKKRVNGWGPQESVIAKELEECGIDLAMVYKKTIENKVDLEAEAIRWGDLDVNSEETQKLTDDLGEMLSEIKTDNDQYYALCTLLEKSITDEVVDKFPILLNSSPDHILKLSEILVKYIPDMAEELNDLIFEAESDES